MAKQFQISIFAQTQQSQLMTRAKRLHETNKNNNNDEMNYFSSDFKYRLLEKLSKKGDIDDLLDGLLIKSENWQALNLLLSKYKEKVQTIYIDPPFNKETDADYLYNVKYKDSTWASMLENRLWPARDLLSDRGSIFVRCDYNGNWIVRPLMNEIFGEENFRNEIVASRTQEFFKFAVGLNKFMVDTDSILFFAISEYFLSNSIPVLLPLYT